MPSISLYRNAKTVVAAISVVKAGTVSNNNAFTFVHTTTGDILLPADIIASGTSYQQIKPGVAGTYSVTVNFEFLATNKYQVNVTGATKTGFSLELTGDQVFHGVVTLSATDYLTVVNKSGGDVTLATDTPVYIEVIKIN